MTDTTETTQQPINGYIEASLLISQAVNEAFARGATIDEVFAALDVQKEVTTVKLTQAVLGQQQREAMAAQQAAHAAAAEVTENANAN